MGGVQDPGGSGNGSARVLQTALQQLIDEVEGDFVVYSLRPPTADVEEYAQTVTRTGDQRAGYLASYWGRLKPSDFPSWPASAGIPMVVDLAAVSVMERQLIEGSPIEVGSMLTVAAHNGVSRLGTLCVVRSDSRRRWSAVDQEAVLSAGALLSACAQADAVTIDRESAANEWRQVVYRSHALAAAARLLRSGPSDEALQRALLEVLPTSEAAALFVEINRTNEQGQSVSVMAANVESDGGEVSQVEYWQGMPWDRMPESRDRLSRGLTHVVRRGRLKGVEAETYAGSHIGSEVDVPLFKNGDWVGLIGMADGDESFDWSLDVPFLQILGDLVESHFDRNGVPAPSEG
jgi:hypothetical protein